MGLDGSKCRPTVACTYDGNTTTVYHLLKPADGCTCPHGLRRHAHDAGLCMPCTKWHAANAASLFTALDKSPFLCGYNCVRFDIPFLQKRYALDDARVGRWVAKCVDLFFFVCHILNVYCKLQRLLEMNGMQSKSASGSSAIAMAEDGRWEALASYCSDDVRLTHHLTALDSIRVPAFKNTASMCIQWQQQHQHGPGAPPALSWAVVPDPDPFGLRRCVVKRRGRGGQSDGGSAQQQQQQQQPQPQQQQRSSGTKRGRGWDTPATLQSLFGDDDDDCGSCGGCGGSGGAAG